MRLGARHLGALCLLACAAAAAGVWAATRGGDTPPHRSWALLRLGTLGGRSSAAFAVNDRGWVVGTSKTAAGERQVFLWRHGRMTSIGDYPLGGLAGDPPFLINNRGQIAWAVRGRTVLWSDGETRRLPLLASVLNERGQLAGSAPRVPDRALVWQGGRLRTVAGPSGTWAVSGQNDAGVVVGVTLADRAGAWRVFAWKDGRTHDLGVCVDAYTAAVDAAGHVTASGTGAGRLWPRWNAGRPRDLGGFRPTHMNDAGLLAGRIAGRPLRAAVWEDGNIRALGTLGGRWSDAADVNDRGQVVGRSEAADGQDHAFVWEDGVMTDLGAGSAEAINGHGQIAGFRGHFVKRAVLWTPRPGSRSAG